VNAQGGSVNPAGDATVASPSWPRRGSPAGQAAAIRTALDGDDEFTALHVLGRALRWAADLLRGDTVGTPATAFRAIAVADEELAAAPALFAALSSLVDRGEPAEEVAADLRRYATELAGLNRRMAPRREQLTELLRAEGQWRAEIAQQDAVNAQIAGLERTKHLAARLTGLRAQRDRLAEQTKSVAGAVTALEGELEEAAGPLVTLTEDTLSHLAERTRALLLRAGEQDSLLQAQIAESRQSAERAAAAAERHRAELAEAEETAAEEQTRYEATRDEAARRLTAMRRYRAANQDVAEALAGHAAPAGEQADPGEQPAEGTDPVARALHALDEVQARLEEIDALLAAALSPGKE
jgi:chromosome segregation ATPase